MPYHWPMYKSKRIGALLLMAGEGLRLGHAIPKQFLPLGDKQIYQHALDALLAPQIFDEIVLVSHPNWMDIPYERVVAGGKTRQESSYLGLRAFTQPLDIVLIHDAVRPFVSERILRENVDGAIRWGAVDTCIPTADTLVHAPMGQEIVSIPKRAEFLRGQTPQTFRMDWILKAHENALAEGIENASDDCQLILRLNKKIYIVLGDEKNIKITSEFDLLIAEQIYTANV